jgi:ABC-type transport system involved in multi-copper enzyme maturation permease subunit
LISNDLKFKAIGLYLSKAITRFDYLFGKGMSLFFYLFINLLFMPLLLVFIYANFSDNIAYLFDVQLLMRILLFGGLTAVSMVMITLAVSSMSHSSATVNVIQVCIFFLLPVIASFIGAQVSGMSFFSSENSLFYLLSYYEWWSLISPTAVWNQLGQVIFQQETTYQNIHWSIYVLDLIVMCVLCSWVLHIRIKPVEVVK